MGAGVSASWSKAGFSPRARASKIALRVLTETFTPRTINGMKAANASAPTIVTAILMD